MAHICYNSFVGFDSVSGFVKSPGLRGYQDRSEILVRGSHFRSCCVKSQPASITWIAIYRLLRLSCVFLSHEKPNSKTLLCGLRRLEAQILRLLNKQAESRSVPFEAFPATNVEARKWSHLRINDRNRVRLGDGLDVSG